MIEQLDHVRAQTSPTPAQRRAGRIADATVLANKTFGRDAIAALDGQWVADDEVAELRFMLEGDVYWLSLYEEAEAEAAALWQVGHSATLLYSIIGVPTACPPATAALQLRLALEVLQEQVGEMDEVAP